MSKTRAKKELQCPRCSLWGDLASFLVGPEAAKFGVVAGDLGAMMGKSYRLALEYSACWGSQEKGITWSRRVKCLAELRDYLSKGGFDFDGKTYPLTAEALATALEDILGRGLEGLKNHNYLKQVLIGQLKASGPSTSAPAPTSRPAPSADGPDAFQSWLSNQLNERWESFLTTKEAKVLRLNTETAMALIGLDAKSSLFEGTIHNEMRASWEESERANLPTREQWKKGNHQ